MLILLHHKAKLVGKRLVRLKLIGKNLRAARRNKLWPNSHYSGYQIDSNSHIDISLERKPTSGSGKYDTQQSKRLNVVIIL